MIEYMKTWLSLKMDHRAATTLQYGLLAGVIIETIAVGFSLFPSNLSQQYTIIDGIL